MRKQEHLPYYETLSFIYDQPVNSTHELSTIWLYKEDLNNDNSGRYANVDGERFINPGDQRHPEIAKEKSMALPLTPLSQTSE